MDRELTGAAIQFGTYILCTTGVVMQRKAMMADVHEDDFVLVHTLTPSEEDDYGTFADIDSRARRRLLQDSPIRRAWWPCVDRPVRCCCRSWRKCRNISRMWLMGFCIYYLGQVTEIVALSFASQSTIVAIGSLGMIISPFVAVKVFHETFQIVPPKHEIGLFRKIFHWDLLNLLIIVAGSVLVVLYAPILSRKEEESFTSEILLHKWIEPPFVYYFVTAATLVVLLLYKFFFIAKGPVTLAVVMSLMASLSITMTKVTTELVAENQLFRLSSLVMILTWIVLLISQVVLLQVGMRNFEQSGAFSIGGALSGACTIASGMLYYRTFEDFKSDEEKYLFGLGVVLMFYGIVVFSQRRNVSRDEMRRRLLANTMALEEEEERLASLAAMEATNSVHSSVERNGANRPLLQSTAADGELAMPSSPNQPRTCAIV